MTDSERQAIAKSWRRKLRLAKTAANKVPNKGVAWNLTEEYKAALHKVLRVVHAAYAAFDQPGMYWPDHWHEYQRAEDDARTALRGHGRVVRL